MGGRLRRVRECFDGLQCQQPKSDPIHQLSTQDGRHPTSWVALSGAGNRVEVTAPREDAPELSTGAALVFDLAI